MILTRNKSIIRPGYSYKTSIMRKKSLVTTMSCPNNVDPTFVHMYINSICSRFEDKQSCISSLVFPPIDEQIHILDVLREISSETEITPIIGPLISFLIKHDLDKVNTLLNLFLEYKIILSELKDLATESLPIIHDIVNI